jgi:hypothetical protein
MENEEQPEIVQDENLLKSFENLKSINLQKKVENVEAAVVKDGDVIPAPYQPLDHSLTNEQME